MEGKQTQNEESSFCGASIKSEAPKQKTKYTKKTEPPSELALKDIAKPILHTTMAAKNILTGDAGGFISDGMNALGDLSKLNNNKKELGQKIIGKPDGSTPYYTKPKEEMQIDPNYQPTPQDMAQVDVYGHPKGHEHPLFGQERGKINPSKLDEWQYSYLLQK